MHPSVVLICLVFCVINVYGAGVPLPIGEAQINEASAKNGIETLFKEQLKANKIVMFTKSTCSRSRLARSLMNENYPDVDYHYYEYDTQPLGEYFMYPSITTSGTLKTPQIYMCDQFVGASLQGLHQSGQLRQKLQECANRR